MMIGLIGACVGVLIGWAVGRLTRLIEFRIDVLQRARAKYIRGVKAARDLYRVAVETEDASAVSKQSDPERSGRERTARKEIHLALNETVAISWLVERLFKANAKHWLEIGPKLRAIGDANGSEQVETEMQDLIIAWNSFISEAVNRWQFLPLFLWRKRLLKVLVRDSDYL